MQGIFFKFIVYDDGIKSKLQYIDPWPGDGRRLGASVGHNGGFSIGRVEKERDME